MKKCNKRSNKKFKSKKVNKINKKKKIFMDLNQTKELSKNKHLLIHKTMKIIKKLGNQNNKLKYNRLKTKILPKENISLYTCQNWVPK